MQTRYSTPHPRRLPILALPAALLLSGCQADLRPTAVESPAQLAAAASANAPLLVWSPGDANEGFDFEGVVVGYTNTQEFTLTNAGRSATGTLEIGWAGGASFRITQDDCGKAALPPGRSCRITVEFAPEVVGYEEVVIDARGQRREALGQVKLYAQGLENRLQSSQLVSQVFGNGTEAAPYTKECDWRDHPPGDHCIAYFPWRTLSGLRSETLPAYLCPGDHPYLRPQGGEGRTKPGVQVEGLGPFSIDVYIPHNIPHHWFYPNGSQYAYASGTRTLGASATNWNTEPRSYRIVLHCTGNQALTYIAF